MFLACEVELVYRIHKAEAESCKCKRNREVDNTSQTSHGRERSKNELLDNVDRLVTEDHQSQKRDGVGDGYGRNNTDQLDCNFNFSRFVHNRPPICSAVIALRPSIYSPSSDSDTSFAFGNSATIFRFSHDDQAVRTLQDLVQVRRDQKCCGSLFSRFLTIVFRIISAAPTSIPRVGWFARMKFDPDVNSLATTTFWILPPESIRTGWFLSSQAISKSLIY